MQESDAVNAVDWHGRTALHIAVGSSGVGRTLTSVNIDDCRKVLGHSNFKMINAQDNKGRTALWEAAWRGNGGACELILVHPGFTAVNATNWDRGFSGHTALHYACEKGLLNVCRLIVEHRCFSGGNEQGCGGWTALHDAARNGSVEICKLLLACPRFHNAHAKDRHGRTALDCCRFLSAQQVLQDYLRFPDDVIGQGHLDLWQPSRKPSTDKLYSWLHDLDPNLIIYVKDFQHLRLYSPEQVVASCRGKGSDDELDPDLLDALGLVKLGHRRLLQRWFHDVICTHRGMK